MDHGPGAGVYRVYTVCRHPRVVLTNWEEVFRCGVGGTGIEIHSALDIVPIGGLAFIGLRWYTSMRWFVDCRKCLSGGEKCCYQKMYGEPLKTRSPLDVLVSRDASCVCFSADDSDVLWNKGSCACCRYLLQPAPCSTWIVCLFSRQRLGNT